MKKTLIEKTSDKLVYAFLKNRLISPLPKKFTHKLVNAQRFRKLCESKIKEPIVGFKAAGTGIAVMKKFKEKEPFYTSIYKRNVLKNGKKVKINKATLGIELEVGFKIKKSFFFLKKTTNTKNLSKYITHIAPCIEVVGYRQRKKGIKSFGDLCSDFGANVKFLIGTKKKYKNIKLNNLKTNLSNKKNNYEVHGNTNTVYINPLNSLKFVLKKLIKDKIKLDQNFWVFTGSTVGVVPILNKGTYLGKIDKIGEVSSIII